MIWDDLRLICVDIFLHRKLRRERCMILFLCWKNDPDLQTNIPFYVSFDHCKVIHRLVSFDQILQCTIVRSYTDSHLVLDTIVTTSLNQRRRKETLPGGRNWLNVLIPMKVGHWGGGGGGLGEPSQNPFRRLCQSKGELTGSWYQVSGQGVGDPLKSTGHNTTASKKQTIIIWYFALRILFEIIIFVYALWTVPFHAII